MKQSKLFTKTQKFAPKDEVSRNAQLLIRAGYVHKEMAGVYSLLPLGLRVLEKISGIIKEEMDKIGGQQMKNSVLQNKKNWEKTNRWDDELVDNWFKTKLKNNSDLGLAFTHEEAMTNLMKNYISSYKDLPAYPYDIRTMFRNETRAKSGLMRGREFYWKALYSFSKNKEEHQKFYEQAKTAYQNIFQKVGLGNLTYLTFASGGTFSKYSHEFQTLSEAGEDIIYIDKKTGQAFNKEIAQGIADEKNLTEKEKEIKEIKADRQANIEASCKLYNCEPWQVLKTVVYITEKDEMVGVVIRGDLEINELLLADLINNKFRLATEKDLERNSLVKGFISPVNKPIGIKKWIGDESLKTVKNFNTGANQFKKDLINVNLGRDFEIDQWGNFAIPTKSFKSLKGNELKIEKAIEVGNIFTLGTKFSEPLDLKFKDEKGKEQFVFMGSYGIGISRLMGTIVEVFADDKGIIWPESVAPFQVHLINIGEEEKAGKIYQSLQKEGIEVFWDDRLDKKPGEKFADADLLGFPWRLVVSSRSLESGGAELKKRTERAGRIVKVEELKNILVNHKNK